jgi:fibrillarin-like rRNA methylase
MEKYINWKIVATAVCILMVSMATSIFYDRAEKLKALDMKIDTKVDIKRYESDTLRIESKIDTLINMHMADRPYRRLK